VIQSGISSFGRREVGREVEEGVCVCVGGGGEEKRGVFKRV